MSRNRRWPLKRQGSDKRQDPVNDQTALKALRSKATFAHGFMDIFRRNTSNAGYDKASGTECDGSLRRCATDHHASSSVVHRKTSRAIAAAMARSLSSDTADSLTVTALPSSTSDVRQGHRRHHRPSRTMGGDGNVGDELRWGPPPARLNNEAAKTMPARKPATSLTEVSQTQEFGQFPRDYLSPPDNSQTSLRRNKTYSARTAHARATQSMSYHLSSNITSTARARATCPTPSAEELSKRSSQFVGYWNPTPYSDCLAATDAFSTPPPYSCLPVEPGFNVQSIDDEMMERLSDLVIDSRNGLTNRSSSTSSSSQTSHSPVSPVGLGPAPPRSPARKPDTNTSSDSRTTWAVARGWRTGMYNSYDEAYVQINGFPGPLIRQFESRHEAADWLANGAAKAQRIPSLRTLDIDEDVSVLAKGKPDFDDKDGAIDNLIRRSSSLRRTHAPTYRARA